jgi:membrane protein DedA with SNARE-associated domain
VDVHYLVDLLTSHMPSPAVLIIALLIATFVLEDAATVAAGILAGRMVIDPATALATVLLGTIVGDLALYALGRWFGSTAFAAQLRHKHGRNVGQKLRQHGLYAVIVARFLPGARLPVFFDSGAIRLPLVPFILALTGSALLWTPALFFASNLAGKSWLSQLTPMTLTVCAIMSVSAIATLRLVSRVGGNFVKPARFFVNNSTDFAQR